VVSLTRAIPERIRGGYEFTTMSYTNLRLLYLLTLQVCLESGCYDVTSQALIIEKWR